MTLKTSPGHCDPWPPLEGEVSVFGSYIFESFDEFYRGRSSADLPFGHLDQHVISLGGTYGLTDSVALDATTGFIRTEGGGGLGSEEGLNDSIVGARWKFIDEFEFENSWTPTLALASNIIIAGTYEEDGFPIAPGDGAHGVEFGLHSGKLIGTTGFGVLADITYQVREGVVPDQLLLHAGLFKTILNNWVLSAEYRREESQTGIDLGSDEFSPERTRELKEISDDVEFGLGHTCESGLHISIFYGHTIDGRNTGKKDIFGTSVSYPFS